MTNNWNIWNDRKYYFWNLMEWNQYSIYSKTFLIWNDFSNRNSIFYGIIWNVMKWNEMLFLFWSDCNWWTIFWNTHELSILEVFFPKNIYSSCSFSLKTRFLTNTFADKSPATTIMKTFTYNYLFAIPPLQAHFSKIYAICFTHFVVLEPFSYL